MKIYTITKLFFALVILIFTTGYVSNAQQLDSKTSFPAHPRLLFLNGQEKTIAANIKKDGFTKKIHQTIIKECEIIIGQPLVQQIKIGRRLLDKSRTCFLRVFYLSYAYRITKEEKYLKRAEAEMLAAAAFTDWNPSHFLDVGEMTMALSIGYDWLYNELPVSSRTIIKEAILKKGIEPSLDSSHNGWLKATNNWNQVCNAGIAYGAMATYEDHPQLSVQIINRAITSMALPMQQYAPDGGYPEGYMYWTYGTSFNVMFVSALQVAFNDDFGLTSKPGFTQTASFLEHLSGTSGNPFNYSDCSNSRQFNPVVFWFAKHNKDATLLFVEQKSLTGNDLIKNRLLPAVMIWAKGIAMDKITPPNKNVWVSRGANQVAAMRTSWTNPAAIYVGFKAGSPSASHGHMDVGSFVMDADGVRWAMDLGMQAYETLESKGVDLWNMKQNSQRWQVFRYNNFAHNTLAINNQLQSAKGVAVINNFSSKPSYLNAIADLTKLYDSSVSKLIRGVAIINEKFVVIRDEVETNSDSVTIRWSMVTQAKVKIINDSSAQLIKDGKQLLLNIQSPFKSVLRTWGTSPTTNYDAKNPGTLIVGFEVKLPPNTKTFLNVLLVPKINNNKVNRNIQELVLWPND